MKKDKTQAQAQAQAQAQETLTSTEQLRERLFSLIPNNNLGVQTNSKGKEFEVYSFSYDRKTKKGTEKTTVEIRDTKAIATMLDIDTFATLSTMSIKGLCVAMARLTTKIAEKAGFKSVVDMVAEKHNNLSKNTLSKYRRIGLIFGDTQADGYMWRPFIPQGVSVSNLDVVLTLFDKLDMEKLTSEQLEEKAQEFYDDYICTDRISLTATQKVLKEQVRLIKNPPIEGKVISETDTQDTDGQDTDGQETPETPETQAQEKAEEVRLAISTIAEYYKNNPTVSALIMELIKATQTEETQEQ